MLPFHRRLAEIGLAAIGEFGFVLAGGYAISANGMGDRPSEDVDLFTNRSDPEQFATAVDRLREAYVAAGLRVEQVFLHAPAEADHQAALRAVGRWCFVPARRGNQPIAKWILLPVSFNLH